jgi:hypothetical protein
MFPGTKSYRQYCRSADSGLRCVLENGHGPGVAVHLDERPVADPLGRVGGRDDAGDAEFAADDRGMRERRAYVSGQVRVSSRRNPAISGVGARWLPTPTSDIVLQ